MGKKVFPLFPTSPPLVLLMHKLYTIIPAFTATWLQEAPLDIHPLSLKEEV